MSARDLADRVIALAPQVAGAIDDHASGDLDLVRALERIGELRRLVDGLGVHLAARIDARVTTSGETLARSMGERSAAALIAARAGLDPVETSAWCAVADATSPPTTLQGVPRPPRRPGVAAAMADGSLSVTSAHQICATLDELASTADAEQVGAVECAILDHASGLSSREMRRLCRAVLDRWTPDDIEGRERMLRARSGLQIHEDPDGATRWVLTLHPEAAGILRTALDARTAPRRGPAFGESDAGYDDAPRDPRPLAQRRLDALVDIARESLTHDAGQVAGSPVTMLVTVPLDTLITGIGSATISGVDEPISASTARRLAADAELIPAVLGGDSEPLDLGRTRRIATPAQRRALDLRDGGCVWTNCTASPGWCEVAHLDPWFAGGRTDLANLVLLCPNHHRCFDHDGWRLEWHGAIPWLIPPPHVDASRTPRRAGRLPRVA